MSDDRQPCPVCEERRPVWYVWDDGAVLKCQCMTCYTVFLFPVRDERAAQQRALETVRAEAEKGRG